MNEQLFNNLKLSGDDNDINDKKMIDMYKPAMEFKRKFILDLEFRNKYLTEEYVDKAIKLGGREDNPESLLRIVASLICNDVFTKNDFIADGDAVNP